MCRSRLAVLTILSALQGVCAQPWGLPVNVHQLRNISLVDNWRDPQPVGDFRKVYRSAAASATCAACDQTATSTTCAKPAPSETKRDWGITTLVHFSYYDQKNWKKVLHAGGWPNECAKEADGPSHPGQSPIDVQAGNTELAPSEAGIQLSGGFNLSRTRLWIHNNGHNMGVGVCSSEVDCMATASFGTWPKKLRGLNESSADDYYLLGFHLHWGSDGTKGSEHIVCGKPRAAELHMVFANKRALPGDRNDPDSGTMLTVLGTLIEGGAAQDNPNYAPFLDNVAKLAKDQGQGGVLPAPITLSSLLPADYASKFYTYPGSLTTPPCSQKVTWFVFENFVQVSDRQLNELRQLKSLTSVRGHQNPGICAILAPTVAMGLGVVTHQLLHAYAPWMPYTLTIMIEGILIDLFAYLDRPNPELDPQVMICPIAQECNSMQRSMDMWAAIDGHLLLFIFLPILLFGDAIGLNAHLFKNTFWQGLLLACPGVVFGAVLTGLFAYHVLPYGWSWNLSMAFGSILAATDPVAVVALLKNVGASDVLTMQITGESLMNDGTAMVLFTLFFNMHMDWVTYTPADVIGFFARMSLAAPLFGIAVGLISYSWMCTASRKHSHSDSTMQTTMSIVTAFVAFYFAEQEMLMSGVLATIGAGLVLARYQWPIVASREALETTWHVLEYIGNTLIFFVAGVLTRRALWANLITSSDFGWCCLMYVVMMGIRALMTLLFYPALARLGYGTTPKDAGFMVWGGLRGAVGLALAVFVRSGLDQVDNEAGTRILFMVAGLAFLTLLVNATTSGMILRMSGMVGQSKAKKELLAQVKSRLHTFAQTEYKDLCLKLNVDATIVVDNFHELEEIRGTDRATPVQESSFGCPTTFVKAISNMDTTEHIDTMKARLQAMGSYVVNADQVKLLRECFLRVVKGKYWELISANKLPSTSPAALILLNSVSSCMDHLEEPLHDWNYVGPGITVNEGACTDRLLEFIDRVLPESVTWDNDLHYHLKVKANEDAYHASTCFMTAHMYAQEKIASFFGAHAHEDTPEEITVVLESLCQVALAQERLSLISSMLIELLKGSIVADMLTGNMCTQVKNMVNEGVLTDAEAEEWLHHLEHQQQGFVKFVKAEGRKAQDSLMGDMKRANSFGGKPVAQTQDVSMTQVVPMNDSHAGA